MTDKETLRRKITIAYPSEDERNRAGAKVHEALAGQKAYVDNQIIMNIDEQDEDVYLLQIWVFDSSDVDIVPHIKIAELGRLIDTITSAIDL